MKKALIVSALALAFTGVAQAESSVTLYGIVDAAVGYTGSKTHYYNTDSDVRTSTVGVQSSGMNSDRIGLKGSEDLGNGTSAIFQLENGFDITSGKSVLGGRLFGRRAIIGLTSDSWGTLTMGRDYNAGTDFLAPMDPFGTMFGYASIYSTFGFVAMGRADSVIRYISPSMEGFQFGIAYMSGENGMYDDETTQAQDAFGNNRSLNNKYKSGGVSLGAGYTNGPLYIGVGYDYFYTRNHNESFNEGKTAVLETDTNVNSQLWNIGGTYDFGVAKLHVLYGQQIGGFGAYGGRNADGSFSMLVFNALDEINGHDLMVDGGLRGQSWLVGLTVPTGDVGEVLFSYQGDYFKNDKLLDDSYKNKGHMFGIAYKYKLSKRTTAYVTGAYGWSNNYKNDDKYSKTQVGDFLIGLNHRF